MTKSIFLPFALLILIGVATSVKMGKYEEKCLDPGFERFPKNGVNGLIHAQFAKFDGPHSRTGGICYWLWVKSPDTTLVTDWDAADRHCRHEKNLPNGFIGGQVAEIDDIAVTEISEITYTSFLPEKQKRWWVGPQKTNDHNCPEWKIYKNNKENNKKEDNGNCDNNEGGQFLCQSIASAQHRCYEYEGWKGGRNQLKVSNNTNCAACITLTKENNQVFYMKCATEDEKCDAAGKTEYIPKSGQWLDYHKGQSKFKVDCCVGDLCNDAHNRCYEYEGWEGGRNEEKVSNDINCAACITLKKPEEEEAFYKKCASVNEKCGQLDYIPKNGESRPYPKGGVEPRFLVECCEGDLCNNAKIKSPENEENKKTENLLFALTQ